MGRAGLFLSIAILGAVGLLAFESMASAADLAASPAPEQAPAAKEWSGQLSTEFRFFSWGGTRGDPAATANPGGGSEFYTPTSLSLVGNLPGLKVETLLRGGFVTARQSTFQSSGSVEAATDTVFTTTLTYLNIDGFQPFAGVSFNLPTGRPRLFGPTAPFARMDPDLVDVPTFGEGFNVGPTVGANIPFTPNILATISGGYTARGDFSKEAGFDPLSVLPQGTQLIRPGNISTITASLTAQLDQWTLQGSLTGTYTEAAFTDGIPVLRSGEQVSASGSVGYAFTNEWSAKATASWAYSHRNWIPGAVNMFALMPEPANSNSNVYTLRLEPSYHSGPVTIGPVGGFLYRDHNAYAMTQVQFVPAKTRVSAGGQGSYAFTDAFSINARAEHIWTHEYDQMLSNGVPAVFKNGWVAVVGGTVAF